MHRLTKETRNIATKTDVMSKPSLRPEGYVGSPGVVCMGAVLGASLVSGVAGSGVLVVPLRSEDLGSASSLFFFSKNIALGLKEKLQCSDREAE